MNQGIAILTLMVVLAQDTPQGRFVTVNGELPANTTDIYGVTAQPGKEGESVSVTVIGTAPAESFEPFAKGTPLTISTNGKVLPAVNGVGVVAISLEEATDAGDLVEILLK